MSDRLGVELAGVKLRGPTVLASGVMGVTAASMGAAARAGAGAVTAKSVSLAPRTGHRNPVVVPLRGGSLLNAVGLSNPGARAFLEEMRAYRAQGDAPLFASVFAGTIPEFGEVAGIVAEAKPDLVEVNVSCPNVHSEFGEPFGADPKACAEITRTVKRAVGDVPVSIKLTVQCPSIAAVAKACADAGADALTAINTVGPGMDIDLEVRRPVLTNRMGGLSGPAILPIAVRAVYQIRAAVKLPIIGTGGVETAEDALQLIMAGATAVGIGTAVWTRGLDVFDQVHRGLLAWMDAHGVERLADLTGAAHG